MPPVLPRSPAMNKPTLCGRPDRLPSAMTRLRPDGVNRQHCGQYGAKTAYSRWLMSSSTRRHWLPQESLSSLAAVQLNGGFEDTHPQASAWIDAGIRAGMRAAEPVERRDGESRSLPALDRDAIIRDTMRALLLQKLRPTLGDVANRNLADLCLDIIGRICELHHLNEMTCRELVLDELQTSDTIRACYATAIRNARRQRKA